MPGPKGRFRSSNHYILGRGIVEGMRCWEGIILPLSPLAGGLTWPSWLVSWQDDPPSIPNTCAKLKSVNPPAALRKHTT